MRTNIVYFEIYEDSNCEFKNREIDLM